MTYTLQAFYPMSAPRMVERLPTIHFARRQASHLLDDGARTVMLYRREGDEQEPKYRFIESVEREN